eukprot:2794825-Amphidinium_carterae.1
MVSVPRWNTRDCMAIQVHAKATDTKKSRQPAILEESVDAFVELAIKHFAAGSDSWVATLTRTPVQTKARNVSFSANAPLEHVQSLKGI